MKKFFHSYYDWIAPIYDVLMKVAAFIDGVRARKERIKFVQYLDLNPGQQVLEIGVGTGLNIPLIAPQVIPDGMIVGLDISIPMLKRGRKRILRGSLPAHLLGGNAESLPFKSDYFDLVYIFGCFNALANPEGTVREMLRVTRPGALIVISDKSLAHQVDIPLREKLMGWLDPNLTNSLPVGTIPLPGEKIQMDWMWKNMMYIFIFRNPAV